MLRSVFGGTSETQNNRHPKLRLEASPSIPRDIQSSLKESVKKIMKTRIVIETKKYAGQSIT